MLVTASGLVVVSTGTAVAAEITDAITDVRIQEEHIDTGFNAMRLDLDFHVGAGIEQGGTVQGGDTFWVEIDPRLYHGTATFPIYAVENPTEVVANVSMTGGNLATFTLTDYVNTRTSTAGSAFWSVSFRDDKTPPGTYTLVFTTASREFQDGVIVDNLYQPGINFNPTKVGVWGTSAQDSGQWRIRLPNGPASLMVFEDFGHQNGPGWEFDCTKANQNLDNYRYLVLPAHEVSFECTSNYIKWVIADVPRYMSETSNYQYPRLLVDFIVTDPSTAGDLVFVNTAQYQVDNDDPDILNGELRRTRGGTASGPTTPVTPTVTQSVCSGTTPTEPLIELPLNGAGVTYSLDNDDYEAGDTVHVIGELSSGYLWDTGNLPDGWTVNGDNQAVFTIELDAPSCAEAISPVTPTVTQATCIAGTGHLTTPTIETTNTSVIQYRVDGTVVAGETVQVIAELQDTVAHEWDDDLPTGWSVNADGDAVFTVVLASPPCAEAISPVSPTVTQATCIAGTGLLTTPTVETTNTSVIHYRVDGTISAGETVLVIAELQDTAANEWDESNLPTGWTVNADGDAVFTVVLDSPPCAEAIVPVSPTVTQATCIAGTGLLTTPTVESTDTSTIQYRVDGTVGAGETVLVIAELQDTVAHEWDDDLPTGWSVNADGDAVFTVVLASPPCAEAISPVSPTVTQATCIAGTGNLTTPTVETTDTSVIHYRVDGTVAAGETVLVIAELQDTAANEWDESNLPDGWTVNPAGDAILTLVLESVQCLSPSTPPGGTPPGNPPQGTPPGGTPPGDTPGDELSTTGAAGAILPIGLAAAGTCLGLGAWLLMRRRWSRAQVN